MKMSIPPCVNCTHFDADNYSCPAFKEIPEDILSWDSMHKEIRSGQQGDYVYTPLEVPWEYQVVVWPETM